MSQAKLFARATIPNESAAAPPANDARDRYWSIVRSVTFCGAVNLVAWTGMIALGFWLI